jgi:hypothetical protein
MVQRVPRPGGGAAWNTDGTRPTGHCHKHHHPRGAGWNTQAGPPVTRAAPTVCYWMCGLTEIRFSGAGARRESMRPMGGVQPPRVQRTPRNWGDSPAPCTLLTSTQPFCILRKKICGCYKIHRTAPKTLTENGKGPRIRQRCQRSSPERRDQPGGSGTRKKETKGEKAGDKGRHSQVLS